MLVSSMPLHLSHLTSTRTTNLQKALGDFHSIIVPWVVPCYDMPQWVGSISFLQTHSKWPDGHSSHECSKPHTHLQAQILSIKIGLTLLPGIRHIPPTPPHTPTMFVTFASRIMQGSQLTQRTGRTPPVKQNRLMRAVGFRATAGDAKVYFPFPIPLGDSHARRGNAVSLCLMLTCRGRKGKKKNVAGLVTSFCGAWSFFHSPHFSALHRAVLVISIIESMLAIHASI